MTQKEIEDRICEFFEQNYELLRLEGGHALTPDSKQAALQQVLFYYRKLREVAEKVTDTEVRLTLPDQLTGQGRRFTIEGIVDIIREGDEVWMYDIKTHDPDYIRANKTLYEEQLNVYAHIFDNLRENQLDHTAVISTAFPQVLKAAIASGDPKRFDQEFTKWEPTIEIPFDEKKVQSTIKNFGEIVDQIESNCFESTSVKVLRSKVGGTNTLFVSRVCRNCDARFSCDSFREYAIQSGNRSQATFNKYFEDFGSSLEQEEFITANINLEKINYQPDNIG